MARGPNFVYAAEFIRDRYGPSKWEEVLQALSAEAAEVWRGTLLVTGAYPFRAFKEMLAALADVVGALPEEETARMYEFIADRSLSTIHKLFFNLAEPSFAIKRYPQLWQRFFEAGSVEVPTAGRGSAVLVFRLPEIFLDWLPPACLGYSTKAVEMAGGKDLKQEEISREEKKGLWVISYKLSWKEK